MNNPKAQPEEGPERDPEAVDIEAIDRFLKGGVETVPQEESPPRAPVAEVVPPLETARDPVGKTGNRAASTAKKVPSAHPFEEFDPGLNTLLLHEPFGDMEVRISPDRMVVSVAVFIPRLPDISVDQVVALLKANHIVHGIDRRAVETLLRTAAKRGKVALNVIVAQGTPMVEGRDAQFVIECLDDRPDQVGDPPGLTDELLAEMDRVRRAFRDDADDLRKEPLKAVRVAPGECILRKAPHQEGQKGTSIFGVERLPQNGRDIPFRAGANVRMSEDGTNFFSEALGYLVVHDRQVSVIPAVMINREKTTAWFVNLPPWGPGRPLPESHLRTALAQAGVKHGVDAQVLSRLCAGEVRDRLAPVANATHPVDGINGQTDPQVEVAPQPGKVLEDGAIDFRERRAVPNVSEGQLLAVYTRATPGADGASVTGETLRASKGKEARPRAGASVRVEEDEKIVRYFSETTGHVRFSNNRLSVHPGFLVSGDVSYRTGNIDFSGDVEITGSVKSGFSVKAGGSVTISGSVETGAQVEAGEDLIVAHGIVGPTTLVKTGGDLLARFIAGPAAEAGGNVIVGSYVHNASISAGGFIRAHGRGRLKRQTSAVVGGSLIATQGIRAASAGSGFGSQTHLVAGVDARDIQHLQKIRTGVDFCETNTVRILRTLRITEITPEHLQRAVQNAPAEKRPAYASLVGKLRELAQHRKKLSDEGAQIRQRQDETLRQALIRVDGVVYPGVRVQIGPVATQVNTPLEAVNFRLDVRERKITLGAVMESLV